MTRLRLWLASFRVWAAHQPLCPPQAPVWTDGDAAALAGFLAGPPGRKLTLLFRYQEQAVNASAVSRPTGCDYNCGYACGFRAAVAMVIKLSANVPPHPDDGSQNLDGAEDLAERHAP